jgi:hypothetical protein
VILPVPFQRLTQFCLTCGFRNFPEPLINDLRNYANDFFNLHRAIADHDLFFGLFTPSWLSLIERHHYFEAIKLWNLAIGLSINWETRNKPNKVHKGTPYYFLGVTGILNNELENGFLAMHQAMKEDERHSGGRRPEAPAYWFTILDSSRRDQFFIQKVEEVAAYLDDRLYEYSVNRGNLLRLSEFRHRFLRLRYLSEEAFFFVYSLFRIRKVLFETSNVYKRNVFSSLLQARILFDLSVVADKLIESKNIGRGNRPTLRKEILFLSTPPRNLLCFNATMLDDLNDEFDKDFSRTMYGLLLGTYTTSPLNDIERDFAIAYGIRNRGAHKLENQPVMYNKTKELTQSILNTIFFTVENLY